MLSIPDIVKYCDSSYSKGDEKCDNCTNDKCEGACARCFTTIHKFEETRDYDCPNLMHHYVCTYLYAYSSEIWHLFNADNDLRSLEEYKVLSIGCGPASELFGISKIAGNKKIDFRGYDINNRWENIHEKVLELASKEANCNTELYIGNVFEEFDCSEFMPNIILLSYLISHLSKSTDTLGFLIELIVKILNPLDTPYYVVVNDINHWKKRNYYELLYRRIKSNKSMEITGVAYYFQGYAFGIRHNSKILIETIPDDILSKYDTWKECKTTAQMIIKVNKK